MKLDNSRVLEALEHSDFPLGCLALHRICQAILLVDFHCILPLISFIEAEPDRRVGALTNDSSDMVGLELATCVRPCRHMTLVYWFVQAKQIAALLSSASLTEATSIVRRSVGWDGLAVASERPLVTLILSIQTRNGRSTAIVRSIQGLNPVWMVG